MTTPPKRSVYYRLDLTREQAEALLKLLTDGEEWVLGYQEEHLITVGAYMRRLLEKSRNEK